MARNKIFSMKQLNSMGGKELKALQKQRQKAYKAIHDSKMTGKGKRGNPHHGKDGRFV